MWMPSSLLRTQLVFAGRVVILDPLDKVEIIVKHEIKNKKTEFERARIHHSPVYLDGLQHEIDAVS
jgi:hypothetical protein